MRRLLLDVVRLGVIMLSVCEKDRCRLLGQRQSNVVWYQTVPAVDVSFSD